MGGVANNLQHRSVTPSIQRPTRNHELGQTYEYDNAIRDSNEIDQRPVYDSSDGPVPMGGRAPGGRGKADVFVSGESFGGQKEAGFGGRAVSGSGARGAGQQREAIGENFLEDEDESELHESGEIDPRLFR